MHLMRYMHLYVIFHVIRNTPSLTSPNLHQRFFNTPPLPNPPPTTHQISSHTCLNAAKADQRFVEFGRTVIDAGEKKIWPIFSWVSTLTTFKRSTSIGAGELCRSHNLSTHLPACLPPSLTHELLPSSSPSPLIHTRAAGP